MDVSQGVSWETQNESMAENDGAKEHKSLWKREREGGMETKWKRSKMVHGCETEKQRAKNE